MVKKGAFRSRELLEEVALWQVLGFLWKGGIPILEAMDVVKNAWPRFSKALGKIVSAIREGRNTKEGFVGYEHFFQKFVPGMITLGEIIGKVQEVCLLMSNLILEMAKAGNNLNAEQFTIALDFEILAMMIEAGVEQQPAIGILHQQTTSQYRKAWGKVAELMREEGKNFPDSVRDSGCFPDIVVADLHGATIMSTNWIACRLRVISERFKKYEV